MRYLVLLFAGCTSATFQGRTLPPIADRALVTDASIESHGERIGSVRADGSQLADSDDVRDQAALRAARAGGTHLVVTSSGYDTYTYTNPASESTTCTDNNDSSTCTTTYTPESTSTVSKPYASYDVYRVERERWRELGEQPTWDPSHHVPSAADGWGITFGGFQRAFTGKTSGNSGDVFPTAYTADVPALQGGWLSASLVRGSTELAFDMGIGGTSFSGTARNTADHTATVGYTGTYVGQEVAFRLGKRIAWDRFALAAGVGIAGAWWSAPDTKVDPAAPIMDVFVQPTETVAELFTPVWASLTVKPSCNWGVQGLAEYDVHPFGDTPDVPALALGLIYQPATACF
jgi:hypothetical protein